VAVDATVDVLDFVLNQEILILEIVAVGAKGLISDVGAMQVRRVAVEAVLDHGVGEIGRRGFGLILVAAEAQGRHRLLQQMGFGSVMGFMAVFAGPYSIVAVQQGRVNLLQKIIMAIQAHKIGGQKQIRGEFRPMGVVAPSALFIIKGGVDLIVSARLILVAFQAQSRRRRLQE
jgi:hypothetical protein